VQPGGFILFGRNHRERAAIAQLIDDLRDLAKRNDIEPTSDSRTRRAGRRYRPAIGYADRGGPPPLKRKRFDTRTPSSDGVMIGSFAQIAQVVDSLRNCGALSMLARRE